jgi:hypothetical protein
MFQPWGGLPFWSAVLSLAVPDLRWAAGKASHGANCCRGGGACNREGEAPVCFLIGVALRRCWCFLLRRRLWYRLAVLLRPDLITTTVAGGLCRGAAASSAQEAPPRRTRVANAAPPPPPPPPPPPRPPPRVPQRGGTFGGPPARCWTARGSRERRQAPLLCSCLRARSVKRRCRNRSSVPTQRLRTGCRLRAASLAGSGGSVCVCVCGRGGGGLGGCCEEWADLVRDDWGACGKLSCMLQPSNSSQAARWAR